MCIPDETIRCPRFNEGAIWLRHPPAEEVAIAAKGISSYEAPALFGASQDGTPLSLYALKAGRLDPPEPAKSDLWHCRLKGAVADGICADQNWKIIGRNGIYARSLHFVRMIARFDLVVRCPDRGVGFLSIIEANRLPARASTALEIEIQHQLECSGLTWGAIGGLIGANETKVFIRERDREVGAEIGNRVTDLWRRVRDNDPPGADYLKDAAVNSRAFAAGRKLSPLLAALLRIPVNQHLWLPSQKAA